MSYERFSKSIRQEVKQEQQHKCAYCGTYCDGTHHTPPLEIHHVIPNAAGGEAIRQNAIGLCGYHPEGGCDCHQRFDNLYFQEGKTVYDVLLEEGRVADYQRLQQLAGIPSATSPDRLRRPELPQPQPQILQSAMAFSHGFYDEAFRPVSGGSQGKLDGKAKRDETR